MALPCWVTLGVPEPAELHCQPVKWPGLGVGRTPTPRALLFKSSKTFRMLWEPQGPSLPEGWSPGRGSVGSRSPGVRTGLPVPCSLFLSWPKPRMEMWPGGAHLTHLPWILRGWLTGDTVRSLEQGQSHP